MLFEDKRRSFNFINTPAKITNINAIEVLDSRGNPTIEVEIIAEKDISFSFRKKKYKAWARVPSGASTGDFEAVELRDNDTNRFNGKGVLKAIKNIEEEISLLLLGKDPTKQRVIDQLMIRLDGTDNKSKLGANAILAVSMATARLGAMIKNQRLFQYINTLAVNTELEISRPFFNVINGGVHAGNKLAFQEFMISPRNGNFADKYRAASEIYHSLKKILENKFGRQATLLGDEGGFAPNDLVKPEEVFDLLLEAVKKAGYEGLVDFAIDVAASEFFVDEKYNLGIKDTEDNFKDIDEMIEIYLNLVEKYPLISIEDPFDQKDFEAFSLLRKKLENKNIQVVGDDLTVTNPSRIRTAIRKNSCDTLLLKLNQIGTVTEAIEALFTARSAGWNIMVSHRSGETIDDFIADFAVGVGAEQIKSGAPARGERTSKYNRLLAIEKKTNISL